MGTRRVCRAIFCERVDGRILNASWPSDVVGLRTYRGATEYRKVPLPTVGTAMLSLLLGERGVMGRY